MRAAVVERVCGLLLALSDGPIYRRSSCCLCMDERAKKTLGDVVGGVHGGKYQFSTRGFEGFAGDEFASALAASSANGASDDAGDEPWPKWATELRRPRGGDVSEASAEEVEWVEMGTDGSSTVRVANIYRSWDRFYATIFADEAANAVDAPFVVVGPSCGDLAPRGGANNVCDASKPYLDHADIVVQAREAGREATLLVRTEEEQWLFRLVARGNIAPVAQSAYPRSLTEMEEFQ